MQGALNGAEAVQFAARTNPLVKFHGCLHRKREETLWTQGQLHDPAIADRIQTCFAWMTVNLPAKDLLIVGFWTDWGYFNDVLANAIAVQNFNSVTVIDPAPTADLQTKAPALWNRLAGAGAPLPTFRRLARRRSKSCGRNSRRCGRESSFNWACPSCRRARPPAIRRRLCQLL
jgi:hypothetical protein